MKTYAFGSDVFDKLAVRFIDDHRHVGIGAVVNFPIRPAENGSVRGAEFFSIGQFPPTGHGFKQPWAIAHLHGVKHILAWLGPVFRVRGGKQSSSQ